MNKSNSANPGFNKDIGIDIIGAGMLCSDGRPVMVDLPGKAPHESCPAYSCAMQSANDMLPPGKLRRLGQAQKMAIAASNKALANFLAAKQANPLVAVTVGTGLGALEQTTRFVENMIASHEEQPRPTCFINSVHNSVASQIAMMFGFKQESHTFTHDSISFELALSHAMNILRFGRAEYVVTCGVDELNPYLLAYGEHYGWWKRDASPLSPMSETAVADAGTIAGEGSATFLLGRAGAALASQNSAKLLAVNAMPIRNGGHGGFNPAAELEYVNSTLAQTGLGIADIEFFLFGANGGASLDAQYLAVRNALIAAAGRDIRYGVYKHVCGEYCTASAVGLAVALSILLQQEIPTGIERSISRDLAGPVSNVLLYNLYPQGYHSLCLVSV